MASVMLPGTAREPVDDGRLDPLQLALRERHGIEVPIIPWPREGTRLVRMSAQHYNEPWEYERLAAVLSELLRETP